MKFSIEFSLKELDLIGASITRHREHALVEAGRIATGRPRLLTDEEQAVVPLHQVILLKIEAALTPEKLR